MAVGHADARCTWSASRDSEPLSPTQRVMPPRIWLSRKRSPCRSGLEELRCSRLVSRAAQALEEAIVSELYSEGHRRFQDGKGTRNLADRLESLAHNEFDAGDRAFIEAAAMFFLATVDHKGRPTVSYKGGAPGFVRITAPGELVFPLYDGNGMYLSLGNIAGSASVGMLFIDFEAPRRLRVQGTARILKSEALLREYPGAQHLVAVVAEQVFVNCGRYIHKVNSRTLSPHVPSESGKQPFPQWKRIDILAETLSDEDKGKVARAGGATPVDAYRGEDAPDPGSTLD
jgi:uncharacterized protein